MRSSILIWIAGAVTGWAFVIVSLYFLVRTGDAVMATFLDTSPSVAREEANAAPGWESLRFTAEELKALNDVAPSAGSTETAKRGATAQAPAE